MKCKDVLDLLPAYTLGELDAEPRRGIEDHLANCGSCRDEGERRARALSAMRSLPALETAEARRDRAAEAMAREHADRVQGILLSPRRRRRWLAGAAAAALLAALVGGGAWTWIRGRDSCSLRVVEVRGRAQCFRNGAWRPVHPGMRIESGDRIVTGAESVLSAELHIGGRAAGTLHLNQNTSLLVSGDRTLDLERGEICGAVVRGPLHVRAVGNDTVTVRSGRFESGLRETVALVLSAVFKRPKRPENADVEFEDQPFATVAREVEKISGHSIRPGNDSIATRHVWFYGIRSRKGDLLSDFETAMRDQGIWFRREADVLIAQFAVTAEKREVMHRLFARVTEGEATIASTGGALKLLAGEEGIVQTAGTPAKAKLSSNETPWLRGDYYSSVGRRKLSIPGTLAFRVVRQDDRQPPLVECVVEGAEILAVVDGEPASIRVESAVRAGEGEVVVPVRIRFDRRP